ncbi:MAG: transaldolase family protein [Anaerolineales bacterium]|nr:transaldolase family protein [Anaerolineales bacterium]
MTRSQYKSILHQMVSTTPTDYWNDSSAVDELEYAIENGAVGSTTNPPITLYVLKKDPDPWKERACQLFEEHPTWGENEIAWRIFEEIAVRGAGTLHPVFLRENGLKGRLSIQADPTKYRNVEAMVEQAVYFDGLAPNLQVKIPVTNAGVEAIEEATVRGVNINATGCFTVPQALAVGEAVDRGLNRRQAQGMDISSLSPVCTIMIGRLDDWMRVLAERDAIIANPECVHWAGVAALKKAYRIYMERGYRARLLGAAYRHHRHWSEFIGGDLILSIPHKWQLRFNASAVEVKSRIEQPVDPDIVNELYDRFPDFRRAYDEDGMSVDEFDTFGPTVRTMRGFINAFHQIVSLVRDYIMPNPDVN